MSQLAGHSETKTFDYTLQAMHYAFRVDNKAVFFRFLSGRFEPHEQPFQPPCSSAYICGILRIVQTRSAMSAMTRVCFSDRRQGKTLRNVWIGVDFQIKDKNISWQLNPV